MTKLDSVTYRRFDPLNADPVTLYRLYEKVYGDSGAIRFRWEWEFLRHPRSGDIAIWLAEAGGIPVGMTIRTPVSLAVRGEVRKACFATNSMVDPGFRGMGIIGQLYERAAEPGVIQLSKGTSAGMYQALKRMGYRDIRPNTFQVCLVAPFRWVVGKITKKCPAVRNEVGEICTTPFRQIEHFPEAFDLFARNAVTGARGGIVKGAGYMNWRYMNAPLRRYLAYLRESNGEICSCVVLRVSGSTATLVDILWNSQQRNEPAMAIRFARKVSRSLGAVKLVAWGSAQALRRELRSQLFFDNSETPNFSFRYPGGEEHAIDWSSMHIVPGDGDSEYL